MVGVRCDGPSNLAGALAVADLNGKSPRPLVGAFFLTRRGAAGPLKHAAGGRSVFALCSLTLGSAELSLGALVGQEADSARRNLSPLRRKWTFDAEASSTSGG